MTNFPRLGQPTLRRIRGEGCNGIELDGGTDGTASSFKRKKVGGGKFNKERGRERGDLRNRGDARGVEGGEINEGGVERKEGGVGSL